MSKILFVYPNRESYPIIPLGISVLAGVLKYHGHDADVFDITFMMPERLDHKAREKTGVVIKTDVEKYWGKTDDVNIDEAFIKKIQLYQPDIIAFTIVENNYGCARHLLKIAKQASSSVLTIVGGPFPTVASEFFIQDPNTDIICVGEGEYAILELANRLDHKNNIDDIPNLIVKSNGRIIKNNPGPYYSWDPLIYQDWKIFDQRHLMKPFIGKVWKTGFFELSRGCPFACTYCENQAYQRIMRCLRKYRREKPIETAIREIEYMKNKYSLELIFFNDEHFLLIDDARFEEFSKKYKERVGLPFFIQSRAENLLNENRIAKLKDIGCATIGVGVESGNEKIRSELLNKNIQNSIFEQAFANCNKHKIRTTAYVMMGLPFETKENILETAEFCKKLQAPSIAISIFAPYYGTPLRDLCVKNGFMEDRYYDDISVNYKSILKMPQISEETMEELYYSFNDLVYGKK